VYQIWPGKSAAAKPRRGMTLIEILVVVAIIATLAAILFPVFLSARESARQTKCLSNIRTIGSALYLGEWNDTMPSTIGGAHFILLNRYIRAPAAGIRNGASRTVWECPSMPVTCTSKVTGDYWWRCGARPPWGFSSSILVRNSYLINTDACVDNEAGRTRRSLEIRNPSRIVLMTEACPASMGTMMAAQGNVPCTVQPTEGQLSVKGWCRHVNAKSESLIHPYHNMGANFLYCDLHAISQRYVPPMEQWNQSYVPRSPER